MNSNEVIKKFRKLTLQLHPDKNPGCINKAEEKFKIVSSCKDAKINKPTIKYENILVHKALCEDNKSIKTSTGIVKKLGFRQGKKYNISPLDKRVVKVHKEGNKVKMITWKSKSLTQKEKILEVDEFKELTNNIPTKFSDFNHVYQIKGDERGTGLRCYIFGTMQPMI